jgi:hypothetical protein
MKKILILLVIFLISSCSNLEVVTDEPIISFQKAGIGAREHINILVDQIGRRVAGTPGEMQAARYIEDVFIELGYELEVQEFDISRAPGMILNVPTSKNIIASKPGVSEKEIIVGAHYDSVDIGEGADDNASGVAVMLQVAEQVVDIETPFTIHFTAFGAEEIGMQGSQYYADQMNDDEIQNTVLMINLDSLIAGETAYVYADEGERGAIREWVLAYAVEKGLELETQQGANPDYPAGTTGDFSDHAPFRWLGIPYLYFESTNWLLGEMDGYTQVDQQFGVNGEIWHTEYDSLGYIDTTFPGRVDERLDLFTQVLYHVLTEYDGSE